MPYETKKNNTNTSRRVTGKCEQDIIWEYSRLYSPFTLLPTNIIVNTIVQHGLVSSGLLAKNKELGCSKDYM